MLGRGYDQIVSGRRVLVVDDIVNTGHSIRQTAQAVRVARGQVVGAAAYVSRGNVGAAKIGVDKFTFLLEYRIPAWPASQYPLCRKGVPVNTRHAHGKEFLASKGSSP